MATCPSCSKQIPDDSIHCGYCGVPQRGAPLAQEKKTVFGFSPVESEASKTQKASQASNRSQPRRPVHPPATVSQPVSSYEKLPAPAQLRSSHSLKGGDRASTADTLIAGQSQDRASTAETLFASQGVDAISIAKTQFSTPLTPTSSSKSSIAGRADPSKSAVAGRADPSKSAVAGRADATKPVLASEALALDRWPIEPARGAFRIFLIISALLFLGIFLGPQGFSRNEGKLLFSWTLNNLEALSLPISAALLLGFGLAPLPYLIRAILSTLVGGFLIGLGMRHAAWREILLMSSFVLLPAGLFLRWKYRNSTLARFMVALGVLIALVPLIIPSPTGIPLFTAFTGLDQASILGILAKLSPAVLILFLLLSLLAFLGESSTGLVHVWGGCILCLWPIHGLCLELDSLLSPPGSSTILFLPIYQWLMLLACLVISSLGVFQICAKSIGRTLATLGEKGL
jgi:hypothetical protein